VAGEPGALAPHPGLEIGDDGTDRGAAGREAVIGRATVDGALAVEDRVDPSDRFDRQRGDDRRLATPLEADVGEHEELAPGVHDPNAIDALRFSVSVPFGWASDARPRRRRSPLP
jgi:hypothetical protein